MKLDSFVGKSYVAQSPNAEAEETINLMLERVESDQGKSQFSFYRSPGLKTLLTLGGSSIRGLLPLNRLEGVSANDGIWGVSGNTATLFDTNGNVVATRSPIPDDGALVSLAASLTAFGISTAGQVYYIDGSGLHGPITWWGPGITIGDIGVINEFFLFLDTGSYTSGFYFSEPGDINSGTSLNFIPAEASANKFVKMLVDRQEAWLFGSQMIEVFYDNSGNDPNNPFAPNLSAVIPHGIAAKQSAISVDGRICWLGKSKSETGVAFTTNGGYVAQRISNHAVEYQWSTYSRIDDAISWTLTIKGHPLWRLWFPSADVTWEYDFTVDDWRKVLSWNETTAQYHAHLGQVACAAGNSILVGARNSGKIYTTSLDHLDDDGARIRWLRRTPILTNENKRVAYPWFELDMQGGVGLAVQPPALTAAMELELVDLGLNSDTAAVTFRRTQFRFVKSDYPAGSTFSISGVVSNADIADKTVQILDASAAVIASFVIPAGTALQTRIDNLAAWNPSANDAVYMLKLPATTATGQIVIDVIRVDVAVAAGSAVPITLPLSAAEGNTALDQTSGGGDIVRTTNTAYTALANNTTWHFKYNASEWAAISSLRFSAVFTSAVTGSGRGGEICLWDIDAAVAVAGVSVTNFTDPDTYPVYKDVDFSPSLLTDGHTYEVRIRRVGATVANCYFHKARLEFHLNPWSKALIPFRPAKGVTATVSRLKLASPSSFPAGMITSRFVESMGATDPGQPNQGCYLADAGVVDVGGTFTTVTAAFCGPYTATFPAGAPYRSGDISSSLIAQDRYGLNKTAFINYQTQMLLYFQMMDPGNEVPETDPKVQIRWSNDWGRTWSGEYQRSMGKLGEYAKRIIKRGCGAARQRVFEVSGSASVMTVINGAYIRTPGVRTT